MAKPISAALKAHMMGEESTIATCWKLVRQDLTEFYFTDHDVDITIDGETYEAAVGVVITSLTQQRGLGVDNMETMSVLETGGKILESEIIAGLFDHSTVDIFQVNYEDLTMGRLPLCTGWTSGNFELRDTAFTAELRGKSQRLNQSIVELYSVQCRAILGDTRCGVDLLASGTPYTQSGSVLSVVSNQEFTITGITTPSDDEVWRFGNITWATPGSGDSWDGLNAALQMEIKKHDFGTDTLTLFEAMPFDIDADDEFTLEYGCSKDFLICDARFSNILSFRGEPRIPTESSIKVDVAKPRSRRGWNPK